MSNRGLLMRVIKGGKACYSKQRVYSVCNGEKRLINEQDIDTDFDINLEIHCTDLKQLELQDKAYNLRRSMGK